MKIPAIELCATDPLKYFSYFKVDRTAVEPDGWIHPLDRLFVRDPIRHNVRQTFRLSIPIMQPDDRAAAAEVMGAILQLYKFTDNHLRMIDYVHTVRLYHEIHKYVLRTETPVGSNEQH